MFHGAADAFHRDRSDRFRQAPPANRFANIRHATRRLNLENSPEESRIPVGEVNLTRDETSVQPQNPAAALDDIVSGKISLHPGWLKDVWGQMAR